MNKEETLRNYPVGSTWTDENGNETVIHSVRHNSYGELQILHEYTGGIFDTTDLKEWDSLFKQK